MKTFAIACAAMMLLAATASASDLAVSKSTLNEMGFGGMQMMSDTDGMAVRGKATFAEVRGRSSASWFSPSGTQMSQNEFRAGANHLGLIPSHADGTSLSFAGQVDVLFIASGPPFAFELTVIVGVGIAGGGATANAF